MSSNHFLRVKCKLTKICSIGLLVEATRNSGLGNVSTAIGGLSAHGSLSESFVGASWRRSRSLSVVWQFGGAIACGWVEMLLGLGTGGISWLSFNGILRWVVHWSSGQWLSNSCLWRGGVCHWLDSSHWLGCVLRSLGLDNWTSHNLLSLSWNIGLSGWEWSKFLLSIVLDVLLILSSLFSEFLINLLSEFLHEVSDSSLNLLVNQI